MLRPVQFTEMNFKAGKAARHSVYISGVSLPSKGSPHFKICMFEPLAINSMNPHLAQNRQGALFVITTAGLVIVILIMTLVVIANLRTTSLRDAGKDLATHSYTLASQAEQAFKSIDLLMTGLYEELLRDDVLDERSFARYAADERIHYLLKQKAIGLPQLDAIALIDSKGKLVNFSRYWPIPDVNISDRDYFIALKSNNSRGHYISQPVQNRGTGTWTIYFARRVSGDNGQFIGLILAAISVDYFESYYRQVTLGEGNAVSIIRDDGALLVRYPHADSIGQIVKPQTMSRFPKGVFEEKGILDKLPRINAAHKIAGLPLYILSSQTIAGALHDWRSTAKIICLCSAVMLLLVLISAFMLFRKLQQQAVLEQVRTEMLLTEKARAVAEAELLREQERSADAANRTKSSFLAMMSHEIRTPMNAVLGLASSLLDTRLDSEQLKAVRAIHSAGDSLLEILNDILEFSKLESGGFSLELRPFSLKDNIKNVLALTEQAAASKGLSVTMEFDKALPPAFIGDQVRIRQILMNMISSAI